MSEPVYPLLFSPLELGPLRLRNRVVMAAMTTGFGFEEGVPDEQMCGYLRARSGGVAVTTVAFGAISPEGRVEEKLPWMWRADASSALAPLAEAIHAGGALASLQLGHGGRQVSPKVTGQEPVAPSAVQARAHVKQPPRPLTIAEIEELVVRFGRAAGDAFDAGFDCVEVHAGHGYLFHQFFSAESNLRTDRYGGATVAERGRFATEVIGQIREEAPRLAVVVRLNGSDLVPGGMTAADAVEAARCVAAAGAHGVIVSAGVYGSVPYTIPMLDDEEGAHLELAGHVRMHVEIPVFSVGAVDRPALAEAALRRGACDGVVVGRALIADPEWVEKAAAGRVAAIRPCVGLVDSCAGVLEHGAPIGCAVNPEVGRELRTRVPRAARPARVAVVGAGPAGLEAACTAAELGHEVVLLERRERPGGTLALAAGTPPLLRLRRLVSWYERRLRAAGVELRTGSDADGDLVASLEPDLVVVAAGAHTEVPVLDGYELLPAWTVEEHLAGLPSALGTPPVCARPVVLGGGRAAMATALGCVRSGGDATLLARERLGWDASGLVRRAYKTRLEREGVVGIRGRPVRLTAEGVIWQDDEGSEGLAAGDGLVIADRRVPETLTGLQSLAVETIVVGDAREPRDCTAAVAEGREAVEAFSARL